MFNALRKSRPDLTECYIDTEHRSRLVFNKATTEAPDPEAYQLVANKHRVAMFLDDIRDCPQHLVDKWDVCVIARSYEEAITHMSNYGIPNHISFDHDLGESEDGTVLKSGHDVAKEMVNLHLDEIAPFPSDFSFNVHSANPVGVENITKLFHSFFKHIRG